MARVGRIGAVAPMVMAALVFLVASPASANHQGPGDRDCGDFGNQAQAQDYYEAHGGPQQDPDRLDGDNDGVACESNPCPCRGPGSSPQPDSDGDGVPDSQDACPSQAASTANGCPPPPDSDGDGLADSADACPTQAAATSNGCPPATAPEEERQDQVVAATVLRVIDGDTIRVRTVYADFDVRLIGIDAPETRKPETPAECGSRQATKAMKRLATVGERVELHTDSTQDISDSYGRLLAYAFGSDGKLMQTETLKLGWTKVYVYERRFKRYRSFRAAQKKARNEERGVWRQCDGDFHAR